MALNWKVNPAYRDAELVWRFGSPRIIGNSSAAKAATAILPS